MVKEISSDLVPLMFLDDYVATIVAVIYTDSRGITYTSTHELHKIQNNMELMEQINVMRIEKMGRHK
jgi:hypothetical protein